MWSLGALKYLCSGFRWISTPVLSGGETVDSHLQDSKIIAKRRLVSPAAHCSYQIAKRIQNHLLWFLIELMQCVWFLDSLGQSGWGFFYSPGWSEYASTCSYCLWRHWSFCYLILCHTHSSASVWNTTECYYFVHVLNWISFSPDNSFFCSNSESKRLNPQKIKKEWLPSALHWHRERKK